MAEIVEAEAGEMEGDVEEEVDGVKEMEEGAETVEEEEAEEMGEVEEAVEVVVAVVDSTNIFF